MTAPATLVHILAYQALRFVNPRESYCLIYLTGGLTFALGVALWRRRRRRTIRLRALVRLFGSRALWLHPSTRLDVKLYLLHGVLAMAGYGLVEASSEGWRAATGTGLAALLGPAQPLAAPGWLVGGTTAAAQLLALELGYWALHYAFHKVPALWALHKVHHSATVMTPLTEWRQHPIEFIAFANMLALTSGVAYALMARLFGPGAEPLSLFQVNALFLLHFATFHHLRHSGVWIAATGRLGKLVHSPAHHQIHHSTDPAHHDRNLGYALSIWDWAFGTLVVPPRRGRVRLGVEGEAADAGLIASLWRPLAAAARALPGRAPA